MAYRAACTMLAALIQACFYTGIALLISWRVALAAVAAGALVALALKRLVVMSRTAGNRQTILTKALIPRLVDAIHGIKPIKAMGQEGNFKRFWTRRRERSIGRRSTRSSPRRG